MRSDRTTSFAKILFLFRLIAVVLVCAAFLEIVTRYFFHPGELGWVSSGNPRLVYELKPNHLIRSTGSRISSQGLHDREFTVEKPRGRRRLAVVGDSTSFGYLLPKEKAFPKVIESLIRRKEADWEVINFSVPGYNTSQEAELVRAKVLAFQPDVVLLVFCGNDVDLCNFIQTRHTAVSWLYEHSWAAALALAVVDNRLQHGGRVCAVLNKAWRPFKKRALGIHFFNVQIFASPGLELVEIRQGKGLSYSPEEVPVRYRQMLGYDNYRRHLADIKETLRRAGVPLLSVGFFTPEALRANQELGIRAFNLSDVIEERALQRLTTDYHYGIDGHRRVASILYRYLVQEGWVS